MKKEQVFRRKNYFIKKGFQARFAVYFVALLLLEALLIWALLLFLSKGTLTAAYLADGLKVASTSSFLFVNFIFVCLIVAGGIGLSALVVFIFLSHRIAGPLYRFEKSLGEIKTGNLSYRIRLRRTDQLEELQDALNDFIQDMDSKVSEIKKEASETLMLMHKQDMNKEQCKARLEILKKKLDFFSTSK